MPGTGGRAGSNPAPGYVLLGLGMWHSPPGAGCPRRSNAKRRHNCSSPAPAEPTSAQAEAPVPSTPPSTTSSAAAGGPSDSTSSAASTTATTGQDQQKSEGKTKYSMQFVGTVENTFRFHGLADFQVWTRPLEEWGGEGGPEHTGHAAPARAVRGQCGPPGGFAVRGRQSAVVSKWDGQSPRTFKVAPRPTPRKWEQR